MKLLNVDANAKTSKNTKFGYLTGILYLSPYNISGKQVCSYASNGCAKACLNSAGRGVFTNVKAARLRKTKLLFQNRSEFLELLNKDIKALERKAKRLNLKPCIRLNGTSDLPFENMGILENYPNVQFYDYSKNPHRVTKYLRGDMPKNYHLTFSRSESNDFYSKNVLDNGGNVAVVFKDKLPKTFWNKKVIDGDKHDLRFLDKKNVIVGLIAKGKAKKDNSGFVIKQ